MRLKITDVPYFVKIPVRLKISVGLKISVRAENPYLKISVRSVCSVQWVSRPESWKGLQAAPEKAGTHDHRKREEYRQPAYICIFAYSEKKHKKS